MKKLIVFLLTLMGVSQLWAQEPNIPLGAELGAVKVRGKLYVDSMLYLPIRQDLPDPITGGIFRPLRNGAMTLYKPNEFTPALPYIFDDGQWLRLAMASEAGGGGGGGTFPLVQQNVMKIIGTKIYLADTLDGISSAKFQFVQSKGGAFRSGVSNNLSWDIDNIGVGSTAFGFNNMASGQYSISGGVGNFTGSVAGSAFGAALSVYGDYASAFGNSNTAIGVNSFVAGKYNQANGLTSSSIGLGLFSNHQSQMVVGRYNDVTGETSDDTTKLFVVGNGSLDGFVRSNMFTVFKDHLQIKDGNQNAGFVLTSDNDGNATWQALAAGTLPIFTQYSVPYADATGALIEDNTGLYYDGNNLTVGHSGFSNVVGLRLNDGRATLLASGFGATFKTTGGVPTDVSKSIIFANSNVNYLKMWQPGNGSSDPNDTLEIETFSHMYPGTTNYYYLGKASRKWVDFYSRRAHLDSLNITGATGLVIADGTQQFGYVLTSDAAGKATWQAPTGGGGGSATWGGIIGTLSSQTDLVTALALKANNAGPTFTGTVVLPSTTSIGTITSTELGYVDGVTSSIQTQFSAKANLASPTLTGVPTTPTASTPDSSGTIASTAFVKRSMATINDTSVVDNIFLDVLHGTGTAPDTLKFKQGMIRRTVANVNTTITASDYYVVWTTLTATRNATLPAASTLANRYIMLKDETGSAATNNITIVGTVNGVVNPVAINSNYGVYRFYSNGSAYFTY